MNMLDNIPDKRVDKNTTSLKFKQDVIDFFTDKKLNNCIEVGTNKGYTTRILSSIFKQVITMEYSPNLVDIARQTNSDRTNIEYLQGDVYNSDWGLESDYDVAFIDCNHDYEYVKQDIKNCLKYNVKYIIFDDYGLPEDKPSVKPAVDEYIKENGLTDVTYIGEGEGDEPRIGRRLVDWEGVIVKI
jgi:hypothetical protein